MTHQQAGRTEQQAQTIWLSFKRRAVPEIAYISRVGRATARSWIERLDGQGPAGTAARRRGDRRLHAAVRAAALALSDVLCRTVPKVCRRYAFRTLTRTLDAAEGWRRRLALRRVDRQRPAHPLRRYRRHRCLSVYTRTQPGRLPE